MVEVNDEVEVDDTSVVCDGGQGPLGHPRVYLAIDHTGEVHCPYCGRRFVLRGGAAAAAGATTGSAEAAP